MKRAVLSAVGCAVVLSVLTTRVAAQSCSPQWWSANEGLEPQVLGAVVPYVFAEFDQDGTGPLPRHLYTAGFFTFNDGQVLTPGIARWDGFQWTSVAQGLGAGGLNFVLALEGYDPDGSGSASPTLIAGGIFSNAGSVQVKNIARWDGTVWSSMGVGFPLTDQVRALASHDPDGAGPSLPYLVAAGSFLTLADGTPCRRVARWDGAAWHTNMQLAPSVYQFVALRSFDMDGAGPFPPTLLGWSWDGVSRYGIFRWTGTQWVYTGLALGATRGAFFDTSSVAVMWDSDGPGPAQPMFHVCDPAGLHRWVGGGWQTVPNSAGGGSLLTAVDEDGPGPLVPRLFSAKGDLNIVRWDGTQWTSIGLTAGGAGGFSGAPYAMAGFDIDGSGLRPGSLFVGGELFSVSGVPAHGLARYGCEESWQPCVGDVNNDRLVNFQDITDVLTNWGISGTIANPAYGDTNFDNVVGFTDITAVLTSWGQDCDAGRSAAQSVPVSLNPGTPMGRLMRIQQEEGFGAMTRALAAWPGAE